MKRARKEHKKFSISDKYAEYVRGLTSDKYAEYVRGLTQVWNANMKKKKSPEAKIDAMAEHRMFKRNLKKKIGGHFPA